MTDERLKILHHIWPDARIIAEKYGLDPDGVARLLGKVEVLSWPVKTAGNNEFYPRLITKLDCLIELLALPDKPDPNDQSLIENDEIARNDYLYLRDRGADQYSISEHLYDRLLIKNDAFRRLHNVGVDRNEILQFHALAKKISDAAKEKYKFTPRRPGRKSAPWLKEAMKLIADFWEGQGKVFDRSTNKCRAVYFVEAVFKIVAPDTAIDWAMREEVKRRKSNG